MQKPPIILTLFGATGDLSQKKLLPALADLLANHSEELGFRDGFVLIGYGRRPWTTADFRGFIQIALAENRISEPLIKGLIEHAYYVEGSFETEADFKTLADVLSQFEATWQKPALRLFYLATAPEFFVPLTKLLKSVGLNQKNDPILTRLMIEKPFGHDLPSAQALNQHLHASFDEAQIYRVDHYLAKPGVDMLPRLTTLDPEITQFVQSHSLDHIQMTIAEDFGIGARGAYYDQTGALRDVVQNHALALLAMLVMGTETLDVRTGRAQALSHFIINKVVTGQYAGYLSEPKVAPGSVTETFAALQLESTYNHWKGIPFYIRVGKQLARKETLISLTFSSNASMGRLTLQLAPTRSLILETNHDRLDSTLTMPYSDLTPRLKEPMIDSDYATLFFDSIIGRMERFVSDTEVETAWQVVSPALELAKRQSPVTYQPGMWGPRESDALIQAGGRQWFN